MSNIILISGGFDPIHSGHICYINQAKKLGDKLIVGLNSDEWLSRKKGKSFLTFEERKIILENLKNVDLVIDFDDADNSAKDAILKVRKIFPDDAIIFANGGDRTKVNIPEMDLQLKNLEFVFGIGGDDKKNSSSWILKKWNDNSTERKWGYYKVLYENPLVKVKELVVYPLKQLSMQKHFLRNEHWHVASGDGSVLINETDEVNNGKVYNLKTNDCIDIQKNVWHQLRNESSINNLHIIEIQHGDKCVEEDILRRE